jgi:hypothetical protein
MLGFFRKEEKQPFGYSTIVEERKGSDNKFYWIIGIVLVILTIGVYLFLR